MCVAVGDALLDIVVRGICLCGRLAGGALVRVEVRDIRGHLGLAGDKRGAVHKLLRDGRFDHLAFLVRERYLHVRRFRSRKSSHRQRLLGEVDADAVRLVDCDAGDEAARLTFHALRVHDLQRRDAAVEQHVRLGTPVDGDALALALDVDGGAVAPADVHRVLGALVGVDGDGDDALLRGLVLHHPLEAPRLEVQHGRAFRHSLLPRHDLGLGRRRGGGGASLVLGSPRLHVFCDRLKPRGGVALCRERSLQITQTSHRRRLDGHGRLFQGRRGDGDDGARRVIGNVAALWVESDAGHVPLLDEGHQVKQKFLERVAEQNVRRLRLAVLDAQLVGPEILPADEVFDKVLGRGRDDEPLECLEPLSDSLLMPFPVGARHAVRRLLHRRLARAQHGHDRRRERGRLLALRGHDEEGAHGGPAFLDDCAASGRLWGGEGCAGGDEGVEAVARVCVIRLDSRRILNGRGNGSTARRRRRRRDAELGLDGGEPRGHLVQSVLQLRRHDCAGLTGRDERARIFLLRQ
mmetsp:Transcript_3426/g.12452  ORF Transcript_3426/g.12452 Transcript_3426/m.12452 type:complete len:521 (-) Transcript_3426:8-1570(-)